MARVATPSPEQVCELPLHEVTVPPEYEDVNGHMGGLISKGHPLGATGLAQCSELTWQLRGEAAGRQADGVDLALQHNIGLGGAAVVTLYRRAT